MSQVEFVNRSAATIPKALLRRLNQFVRKQWRTSRIRNGRRLREPVRLIFVDRSEMKKLNQNFRGKKYATDVLSFTAEPGVLGELLLCPAVIRFQAREHDLSYEQELSYMVIHGLLHLLGYDHEKNSREAKLMFRLQDSVWEKFFKLKFR